VAAASIRTVVDASVLINLIHVNRLDLLGSLEGFEFVVTDQTIEEVQYPEQAAALRGAFERGWLRREESTDPAEIAAYADLSAVMGKGEAACLAMAQTRGWVVACDEGGRFLREARARLGEGRVVNTPGLLLLAIRGRLLTVQEADGIKDVLAQRRYRMPFGSFRELLDES
jgi:predicted nucleic acid-binding protein